MPDSKSRKQSMPKIVLNELSKEDERPSIAVYALDAADQPLAIAEVDEKGAFDLSPEAIRKARHIAVGPLSDNFAEIRSEVVRRFRPQEFINSDTVRFVRGDWILWIPFTRCVNGTVQRCRLYPPYIRDLLKTALVARDIRLVPGLSDRFVRETSPFRGTLSLPFGCDPVCGGTVEVYERLCCFTPGFPPDFRLPDIIEELELEIRKPIPPIPPDPGPWVNSPFLKNGALDVRAIHARRDLAALKTLSESKQLEYVEARPYLWSHWSCGTATKVAEDNIHPDGNFSICWEAPPIIIDFCVRQYAFIVRQVIDGVSTVIYDGLAANDWFAQGDSIKLTSYYWRARACRSDFPEPGTYVLLEHIGDADSWRLQTPDANGTRSVLPPQPTDGLADAAVNPHASGSVRDRNWGGVLQFQYAFKEAMRTIGAQYYRVSYQRANNSGNPTGPLKTFSQGLSWEIFTATDSSYVSLGPNTVNGEDNLYTIPYNQDNAGNYLDWAADQYHAWINTNGEDDGRFLLTIEIFNGAGKRLRPGVIPAEDPAYPSAAAPFVFKRWESPTTLTDVPQTALTHLLWWDNHHAVAKIENLRHNNSNFDDECQFLCTENGSDMFSVGYRAYFPGNALFLRDHTLTWYRGLSGENGGLAKAGLGNIGEEPPIGSPEGGSGMAAFSTMLHSEATGEDYPRCSFSVELRVMVKTFNGYGLPSPDYDARVTAAFALQVGDCGPCECEECEE